VSGFDRLFVASKKGDKSMAMEILFGSDIGLLSLFTIVFVLGMGLYIWRFVQRHMKEEEKLGNH
jgi:hypothetical protein